MGAPNLPGLLLDASHPLSRGLVGWWPLNEAAGDGVNNVVPWGKPGLATGVARSATSGWSGGPFGAGFQFDGTDDIISVPHYAKLALTGDMSACCWFCTTSFANYRSLLIKGNVGAGYPSPFHLAVESGTGYVFAMWGNGSGQVGVYSAAPISANRWYFVVATRFGSVVTLYFNGRYDNAGNLGAQAVTDAGTPLGIGGRTSGTSYNQLGGIAGVRMYDRALSAKEVAQLYAEPMIGAYWNDPAPLPEIFGTLASTISMALAATGEQVNSGALAKTIDTVLVASAAQVDVGTFAKSISVVLAGAGYQVNSGALAKTLAITLTAKGMIIPGGNYQTFRNPRRGGPGGRFTSFRATSGGVSRG